MVAERTYLAIDLGASGGRVLAGCWDGKQLRVEEVHRFDNGGVRAAGSLYWDVLGIWSNIVQGLRAAATRFGKGVHSLGVDTWGIDYALLDENDVLLENAYCYRDARTNGVMERVLTQVPRSEVFAHTGLQFLTINTLYQLVAAVERSPKILELARTFLMMPDVFHWLLTGEKSNEYTNATTTQFFDPVRREWAFGLLERLSIPTHFLHGVVEPGRAFGPLRNEVIEESGLRGAKVILPGTHDTASAVMAVPATARKTGKPNWCYLSAGTWILMGVELPQPLINDECLHRGFTNEGGVGRTTRLLKNITGLWLVQECRRIWARAGATWTWDELQQRAEAALPLVSLVNPDASCFLAPTDMVQAIREACRRTNQPVPSSEGEIVRAAIDGIALRSRTILDSIESLVGGRMETIHIVGGGSRNELLCQCIANACQREVLAGPVEATAIGNVLVQSLAAGDIDSIDEARAIVYGSFEMKRYSPRDAQAWSDALGRFAGLAQG